MIEKNLMKTEKYTGLIFGLLLLLVFLGLLSCSNNYSDFASSHSDGSQNGDLSPTSLLVLASIDKPSSVDKTLRVGIPSVITFSFSEPVTNFTTNHIEFSGSRLFVVGDGLNSDDDSKKHTLDIILMETGSLTVEVPANSFQYSSGASNLYTSNSFIVIDDETLPSVVISVDKPLEKDVPGLIIFSFNEEVFDLTKDEIGISDNVVIGRLSEERFKKNKLFTLGVTPKRAGQLSVEILADSFKDLSDNFNIYTFTNFTVIDEVPPNVTISTEQPLEDDVHGVMVFSFDEPVAGFKKDDIKFPNNDDVVFGKFDIDSSKKYTLGITPKGVGDLTVEILANSLGDLSDNSNSYISTNFTVVDNVPPRIVAYTNEKDLVHGEFARIVFVFSEKVNGFTKDDIGVFPVDVIKGEFVTNSPASYSLEIKPRQSGDLTITIPANSFEDLFGLKNTGKYKKDFHVLPSPDGTYTITVLLPGGGRYKSPDKTSIKIIQGDLIDEDRLSSLVHYPDRREGVGKKSRPPRLRVDRRAGDFLKYKRVSYDRYEWDSYDFSLPPRGDMDLKVLWRNSCGVLETRHAANKDQLKIHIKEASRNTPSPSLNHIDVSAITDMSGVFSNEHKFNGHLGCWDVSKVTDMRFMFYQATAFNQDIERWDTGNVTNMYAMFAMVNFRNTRSSGIVHVGGGMLSRLYTMRFNQPLNNWDVSKVKNMRAMFFYTPHFNQPLNKWDVSSVTDMAAMFYRAVNFNQPIDNWDVSSVRYMNMMFMETHYFDQDISKWDVSGVRYMAGMFQDSYDFNQNIGNWDVSNVREMHWMFLGARSFFQDLSHWDVSSVETYHDMFGGIEKDTPMTGMIGYSPKFK